MTLVLSVATRCRVFHASDRLTTITPTRKNPDRAWDIHANKTVIVVGSDCWLVIGYTGLAYLDNRPTDDVIASALAGGADLSSGMGAWHPGRPLHYREITRSIATAIFDAYSRLPAAARDHPTIVSGMGVQQKRPRLQHVGFHTLIHRNGVTHEELNMRNQSIFTFSTLPIGTVDLAILDQMRTRLRDEGHGDGSPEGFRDIMMDAVAETGKNSDVVGEDVMGVILEPLNRRIRVHFRTAKPANQAQLAAAVRAHDSDVSDIPNVSTPYILAPGMYFSPAVATGGWHLFGSEIDIELTGFDREPDPGPVRAFWGSHPRRAQPT
ncbi:hypothetical protein [Mycobacterium sp. NAZ190054]|uniref:hypothetical protein n=1 Tax=Mycobacterium sp. NAZ190054 TaxID=1747766 RepID=UPI0012E366A4|nr:hypothetical protein [Mycobacterium sp. NAZ190054]